MIAIAAFNLRCSSAQSSGVDTPTPYAGGDTTNTTSDNRQASIRGNAMLGAVAGAQVTVYGMDPNSGVLDANVALGAVVTDLAGEYNILVDANTLAGHPYAVQMRGGSYVEEASGATVELGNTIYTTLLPPLASDGNVTAALGPLPDMAYQLFQHQIAAGGAQDGNLATLISNASYQVSQAFGIPDVVGTLPANPNGDIPNDATGQYTLILAALSHAAAQAGVDSTTMAAAFAAGFTADGNFIGVGHSSVTVLDPNGHSITLAPPSFATLQNTVTDIGNGNIVLPHLQPPASFSPPTFQPIPPVIAPATYTPGAPPVIDPNTISVTPMPVPTVGTTNPNGTTPSRPTTPISTNPNTTPSNPNGVSVPSTPDICATLTYTNYGQAFFAANCLSCHAPGGEGYATIDLTAYANISANQARILGQIETGAMPRNGSLSPSVRDGILAWLSCSQLLR